MFNNNPHLLPTLFRASRSTLARAGAWLFVRHRGLICEINRQMCHFSFLYLSYSKIVREMLASVACHFMCVSKARFVTAVYLASNSFITRKLVGNSNCKQRVALSSLRGQPGSLI